MNKFIKLLMTIIISILSFSSFYIESIDYEYQTYARINPDTDEEEIIDAREFKNTDDLMKQMADDFFAVKEKNNEIVGWLNIPNIGYYPVMMNEDNQYYLTHNEYNKPTTNGITFMNNECNGSFKDIALIHGHHLRSGKMFGSLSKYKDEQFFQNNDLISVFDGEYLYLYRPFSVTLYQDVVDEIKVNIPDKIERQNYLQDLYNKSIPKMNTTPNLNSQILFLSTCEYSQKNGRILVGSYMTKKYKYNY